MTRNPRDGQPSVGHTVRQSATREGLKACLLISIDLVALKHSLRSFLEMTKKQDYVKPKAMEKSPCALYWIYIAEELL